MNMAAYRRNGLIAADLMAGRLSNERPKGGIDDFVTRRGEGCVCEGHAVCRADRSLLRGREYAYHGRPLSTFV